MRIVRPTRRTAALSGAAVLGISGLLVLGVGLQGSSAAPARPFEAVAPVPIATTAAPAPVPAPGESAAPTSTPTPTARHTPSSTTRLTISAVDLDLPLLPLNPRRGVIDPPLLTAGYWIEGYGAPVAAAEQAVNTLYIAAHSAGYGDDGFDPLLTTDHTSAAVGAGDVIEVTTPGGTVSYTVERTQRYGKKQLPDAAEVWEAVPGRLVLITCFQRADGRNSTENLVVFARS